MEKNTKESVTISDWVSYCPESGDFRWIKSPNRRIGAGSIAGRITNHGYASIRICGHDYVAHRLAWFAMTGYWPSDDIDHINGIRSDNRWSNLRAASRQQNCSNRKPNSNRPYKGTYFNSRSKKWYSRIKFNQKQIHLGTFTTCEEAHAAYQAAAHKYFGEFARF